MWLRITLALSLLLLAEARSAQIARVFAQAPPTSQCVTTAVAGGTSDALTLNSIPCVPTTTLLILTATATSATSAPTLKIGSAAPLPIMSNTGAPLAPGSIVINGRYQMTSNGQQWFMLNPTAAASSGGGVGQFDPRTYGAVCNGVNSDTPAIQQAVNAAGVQGGEVVIPCPLTLGTPLSMASGVRLRGAGPGGGYGGQQDTPGPSAYPTTGPAIKCPATGTTCISINGTQGNEIDHLNFYNPQPLPPACPPTGPCNSWNPTVYPFVISTVADSGWQSLSIHDVTCTSCSNFIDLEGTPAYHLYTGTEIILRDLWCNVCLNTGIRFHLIDNPLLLDHMDFVGQWNGNIPSLGYYQRQNLVGFDIQYMAAPQVMNVNFWAAKTAIQLRNDTVNNPTAITLALSAGQFTNMMFNQTCQDLTMPDGNGTYIAGQVAFNNVYVWGDQSGFACSNGKPLFDIPTNYASVSFTQLGVAAADTFANVGCGVPGTGGCPSGQPNNGGSVLRIVDTDVLSYSSFTAAQPFIKAVSKSTVSFGASLIPNVRPNAGAGAIMAAGMDGSNTCMAPIFVGGGDVGFEGAVGLFGSCNNPGSGSVVFYNKNSTEVGYAGAGTTSAVNFKASGHGQAAVGNDTESSFFGDDGASHVKFTTNPLPVTPPSGTGTAYDCVDNAGNHYVKATCP